MQLQRRLKRTAHQHSSGVPVHLRQVMLPKDGRTQMLVADQRLPTNPPKRHHCHIFVLWKGLGQASEAVTPPRRNRLP
jgi:hypothetical protein